jgi:tetratricopeptide (TPR) repeat protein
VGQTYKNVGRTLPLVTGLMVVFVLKLLVLLELKDHPLLQADAGLDTTAYVELAKKVVSGDLGLGPGLYFVSPLYVYFLAAGLASTQSLFAVRLLQIVLGTAAVAGVFAMARVWFGTHAGWIAAGLAALTGLFTFYESILLQASLDAFLTSAALLALTAALRGAPERRGRFLLLTGAIFGIATLNRPNMLLAGTGLALVLLALRRVRPALLLVAGLLAGMAPVAVRNIVVSHQWSLVSSHGGLNFYIGNSETATGFYHPVPGITPSIVGQQTDARRVAEAALGRPLDDAETSSYFVGLATTWMSNHPADALMLFARKFGYVFSAEHVALPHSYPFYAYDARTMLRFYAIGPWLLVPLGLIGLAFAAPREARTDYIVWVSFVPIYGAAVAVFFVAERYRLPLLVPLSVGAGAAIDAGLRAIGSRQTRSLLVPAVALLALFGLANWPHGLSDSRWEEGLRLAQRLVILGRYDEADQWSRATERREGRPGATAYGLGAQLLVVNQPARALAYLERSLALDPANPTTEYALGRAQLQTGRATEAIAHLQRGFDAAIEMPLGGYDLALARQAVGDLAGAASVLRRITPGPDADADSWLVLGRLAAQVKAPDVADRFFSRAVELRPGDAATRLQQGLNLLVLGRLDAAARELGEATRLNPLDPDALSRLAYCEFSLGRSSDARAHAHAALSLSPGNELASQLLLALDRNR